MNLSFRTKTILGIALIEAVMLLLLVWSSLTQLNNSNREALAERADTTATLFATMAKDAVLSTDLATLESYVDEMMRNPGVVYVRVHGYGTILAERGDKAILARQFQQDESGRDPADGIFDTSVDINEGDAHFGRVQLGISTAAIAGIVTSARQTMIAIAGAEIALVAVFSLLLGTYLTRQLKSLGDGVRALTEGKVGTQIPVSGHDELAQTATCFNTMSRQLAVTQKELHDEIEHSRDIAEDLREREATIRDHKKNLEIRVKHRTAEIQALAESLAELIEHANAPIFTLDEKLRITGWNRKAEELTGISKERALGKSGDQIIFRYTKSTILRDACQAAALQGYLDEFELPVPGPEGKRLWLLGLTASRGANRTVNGYTFVGQDITERQSMQAQIIQSSKLATLGEMATAIAHELNQPLNIIGMAASNLEQRIQLGKYDQAHALNKLENIRGQVKRSSEIIDHMRIFGRKSNDVAQVENLSELMTAVTQLMAEQFRLAEIETYCEIPEQPVYALGHRVQIEQVLLNLLVNARDAIRSTGRAGEIHLNLTEGDNGWVQLSIQDSGDGIDEAVLDRIFEPFFTTKPIGKGTGLGLSVSYGIIEDMGGCLRAENTARGARFTIELPIAELAQATGTDA